MKICIVAEGCYPYVRGGVSSWIQMLIQSMPEHEFIIYAIGAKEKDRGVFKIKLPENVTMVKEMFLDSVLHDKVSGNRGYELSKKQYDALYSLLSCESVDWDEVFPLFYAAKKSPINFLVSESYMSIVEDMCKEKFAYVPFTEFFWNARSMVMPLLYLIRGGIPEADLYHTVSTGYAGIMACLGNWLYKKPIVLSEHGIYTREREEEIIKSDWVYPQFKDLWIKFFYLLAEAPYKKSSVITSLYEGARKTQIELGCSAEKTMVIHNGVDVDSYSGITAYESDTEVHIGAIVRVVPIKDIKTMIYAFSYVKERFPNAKFFIAGPYDEDPEYYQQCLQLVDALSVSDISFVGFAKVTEFLPNMNIIVLTSISEGQPLSLLEAMAGGLPFVTTNVGCCRELAEGFSEEDKGVCGYVVPVMNPGAIADAIGKLIKNPRLCAEMGKVGRRRIQAYYRMKDCFDSVLNIYQKVVKA